MAYCVIIFHELFSAIKDYQTAQEIDNNNQRVKEGLDRARKLLKQSQKRDYYKILGVKRYEDFYNFLYNKHSSFPNPLQSLVFRLFLEMQKRKR